jgi:hypothetical protein
MEYVCPVFDRTKLSFYISFVNPFHVLLEAWKGLFCGHELFRIEITRIYTNQFAIANEAN